MKKIILIVAVALVATGLAGVAFSGEEKAKGEPRKVELEGKVLCAKCSMGEEGGCQNVLVVSKNGKDRQYYLVKNAVYEKFGDVCKGSKAVRITGTVKRGEGHAWLTPTSIEAVEAEQG